MTTANKITILRILLIPFFVVEVLYYVRTGNAVHMAAVIKHNMLDLLTLAELMTRLPPKV